MPKIGPDTYVCDKCHLRFYSSGGELINTTTGAISSLGPVYEPIERPANKAGRVKTFCEKCDAKNPINFGGTMLYLHFFGVRRTTKVMVGQIKGLTAHVASAGGALSNLVPITPMNGGSSISHPSYLGGTIRSPGHSTGANTGAAALIATPQGVEGMLHVHVGRGANNRVLIGWDSIEYVANSDLVASVALYFST